MTSHDYREALAALSLTQAGAARLFGVDERTSRRWANDERAVPPTVMVVLRLLLSGIITAEDIERLGPPPLVEVAEEPPPHADDR